MYNRKARRPDDEESPVVLFLVYAGTMAAWMWLIVSIGGR